MLQRIGLISLLVFSISLADLSRRSIAKTEVKADASRHSGAKADDLKDAEVETLESKEKPKAIFYDLVHENVRPDDDEFYVSSIYSIIGHPRALIKRSTNKRAGDLYIRSIEYGIGDKISDNYLIHAIDMRKKEIIVKKIDADEYFGLTVSYGKAKSRLIPKPKYQPKKAESEKKADLPLHSDEGAKAKTPKAEANKQEKS